MSSVHDSQRELIKKAIADQEQIGRHMAMPLLPTPKKKAGIAEKKLKKILIT
jgi:hypothetical protein